jgi:hypothetical protein
VSRDFNLSALLRFEGLCISRVAAHQRGLVGEP